MIFFHAEFLIHPFQMNVGVKGVVPGEPTERHILEKLLKCKFWGGLALALLAVAAYVFDLVCQVR